MKKKSFIFIIFLSIVIFSLALFKFGEADTLKVSKPVSEQNSIDNNEKLINSQIENIVNNLTLEEKIGQMLIVSYRHDTYDEKINEVLTTVKPGGFIFFGENFTTYDKAQTFIDKVINTADIPLFLSIDEEGGRVDRLKDIKGYTYNKIPTMLEVGTTNDENEAYTIGTNIANILKDFKINMDFAPVADVYSNPLNKVIGDRSFGSDPYLVARMTTALAKGLSDNYIIPVYKHFPGHGNTETDSHFDLPIVSKTKDELLSSDLIPFINAINNEAELIMVGHLALPNITGDNTPASLSKILITDILKNELGYQNLIITDALNMQALTKYYSESEIYLKAIKAGVDILLNPIDSIKAVDIIKNAIENKEISEGQINTSVTKILKLKAKYNILKLD